MANYDHNAIYKAYPNVVRIDDSEGIFDASGNPVSIVQSNVDAARVELNKLNYRNERVGIVSGYAPIQDQLMVVVFLSPLVFKVIKMATKQEQLCQWVIQVQMLTFLV